MIISLGYYSVTANSLAYCLWARLAYDEFTHCESQTNPTTPSNSYPTTTTTQAGRAIHDSTTGTGGPLRCVVGLAAAAARLLRGRLCASRAAAARTLAAPAPAPWLCWRIDDDVCCGLAAPVRRQMHPTGSTVDCCIRPPARASAIFTFPFHWCVCTLISGRGGAIASRGDGGSSGAGSGGMMGWLRSLGPGPNADSKQRLDWEFMKIAAPGREGEAGKTWVDRLAWSRYLFTLRNVVHAHAAFVQFTAEPLAGLVDTAYLGRLGPIGACMHACTNRVKDGAAAK